MFLLEKLHRLHSSTTLQSHCQHNCSLHARSPLRSYCTCTHVRLNVLFEIDACMRARVFIHITTVVMRRRMYRNARSLVWSSPRNSWNAACIHLRSVLFIEHRLSSFEIVQVHVIQFFLAYCNSFEVIVLVALPSTLCSHLNFQCVHHSLNII